MRSDFVFYVRRCFYEANVMADMMKRKDDAERKPLVLRGAGQVGKTWIMKEFERCCYENYVYFNFDEEPELKTVFEANKNPLFIALDSMICRYNSRRRRAFRVPLFEENDIIPVRR